MNTTYERQIYLLDVDIFSDVTKCKFNSNLKCCFSLFLRRTYTHTQKNRLEFRYFFKYFQIFSGVIDNFGWKSKVFAKKSITPTPELLLPNSLVLLKNLLVFAIPKKH